MNDNEIKEILARLSRYVITPDVRHDFDDLLDYITNLQQENERLKEENALVNDRNNDYRRTKEHYKSCCEKASNLIEPLVEWGECTINGKMLKSVYDILNGRSDE